MDDQELKIALLTFSYPRFADDEASVFLKRLTDAFQIVGVGGIVVTPRDSSEPAVEEDGKFTLYRLNYTLLGRGRLAFGSGIMRNLKRNPLLAFQIPGLLFALIRCLVRFRKYYDVIQANWVVAALPATVVSWMTGKPFVLTLRGEDMHLLRLGLLRILLAPFVRKASRTITVNESFIPRVVQYFHLPPEKVITIPNGVSHKPVGDEAFEGYVKDYGLSNSTPYLLYLGRVIPLKRIELLLELLTLRQFARYELLVVGRLDGSYHEFLKTKSEVFHVEKRVQFLGAVPPSHVSFFQQLARFYVSASSREGRPNGVLEALAAGTPALVSNISAHAEIVRDGVNGFLFKPENLESIAERIGEIDQSESEYGELCKGAQRSVLELSWDKTALTYRNIFLEVADTGSPR